MDLQLAGKTALVTGGSSGIGAASAVMLAEEGANVVVAYGNNHQGAQETAHAIEQLGQKAWTIGFDVSNPDDVQQALEKIAPKAGPFDLAVLAAGYNKIDPLEELSPQQWAKVVDINLNGTFYTLQGLRPMLKPRASVVLVSSVAGHTGAPHHAHYAAAKAGVINLTKSFARAWAPAVRVNGVCPGVTRTAMGDLTIAALDDDYASKKLLAGQFAQPRDIASVIVFLASERSSFMYGTTVDIEGGRHLR